MYRQIKKSLLFRFTRFPSSGGTPRKYGKHTPSKHWFLRRYNPVNHNLIFNLHTLVNNNSKKRKEMKKGRKRKGGIMR
jgi:hypothetical protein